MYILGSCSIYLSYFFALMAYRLFLDLIRIKIRIRKSFTARYVYTYMEFVLVTEASTTQQNDSDRQDTDNKKNTNRISK